MANRQEGYYWVKLDGVWNVMEYVDNGWECEGGPLSDSYFSEINENRILSPDEEQNEVLMLRRQLNKLYDLPIIESKGLPRINTIGATGISPGDIRIDSPAGTEIKIGNSILFEGRKAMISSVYPDLTFDILFLEIKQ